MAETIDDTKTFTITLSTPADPAKGEIVNLNYPASAKHSEDIVIGASVKNIGASPGNFYLYLFQGATEKYEYEVGILEAGATSPENLLLTTTPASGESVSYIVKCIRITG